MHVDSLEVGNFRNYEFAKIDFHPNTNILYGDNAQGKTNLLEAVFVCGTTKSHKGSKDKELVSIGKEEAHIRLHLTKKEMTHRIDMHLKKNKGKGIAIDGIPIKRSSELLGLLNVIFFSTGRSKNCKKRSWRREENLLIWNYASSIRFICMI